MRLAVLLSGRGSNLQALIDAARVDLPVEIVLAMSDRPCAGIDLARTAGLKAVIVDRSACSSKDQFESALNSHLAAIEPDLIVLAGFMRVLSAKFVAPWANRIINIHPSLLPKYPGLDTHVRVLANQDAEHGATVHYVTAELDAGPPLAQVRMPVLPGDTPQSLAARLLPLEHRLLVDVVGQLAANRR